MRSIGLDVHRDFCEVAIFEDGKVSRHPRVPARRQALAAFAASLRPTDQVGLEATGNALLIARLIEPHVARVVVANAGVTKTIGAARAKTDQLDARTLAQLLGTGFFPEVWLGPEPTRLARRRMSRRAQLVRERTGLKNQIHAVLHRNLVERPPASDLFRVKGLRWLDRVDLPEDERETVSSCLRQLRFLGEELERLDQVIATMALQERSIQLLLTVPGVNLTTAVAFMAAVGDIGRFESPSQLVSYLGLDPKVHQSGITPARHGGHLQAGMRRSPLGPRRISLGSRSVSGTAPRLRREDPRPPGRQRGDGCGGEKAHGLFWHMLTKDEEHAFGDPPSPQRRSAGSSSRPEPQRREESAAVVASTPQPSSAFESSRSPSTPRGPIASSSPNGEPLPEPLDLHP